MKKGKGYRFKKADANSYVFGKLATMKKAPPAEAGVQPKQDVLAAMMAGMTGNASSDNCGTGAGGFKRGNTCASGHEIANDPVSLLTAIGLKADPYTVEDYPNWRSAVIKDPTRTKADKELKRLHTVLLKHGFTESDRQTVRNNGTVVTYDHPQGHLISIHDNDLGSTYQGNLIIHATFVPKHLREGVSIAKEAFEATRKAYDGSRAARAYVHDADRAVDFARHGVHSRAQAQHEVSIIDHELMLGHNEPNEALHRRARDLHSIARDWHMDKLGVQNAADNCGTGKGGFKKGNTCARGSGLDETDWRSLVTSLGINPARFSRLAGGNYHKAENTLVMHSAGDPAHDGDWSMAELSDRLYKSYNALVDRLADAGFQRDPKSNNIWEYYDHPSGHEIVFHLGRINENYRNDSPVFLREYTATLHFVPKENREGVAISREAFAASKKTTQWREAKDAKDAAVMGNLSLARRSHEFAEEDHRRQARLHSHNPHMVKLENDAADLHAIARDWYMQKMGVQNRGVWNNCGTGAGGFKKGNTCASGARLADSVDELVSQIPLPEVGKNGITDRSESRMTSRHEKSVNYFANTRAAAIKASTAIQRKLTSLGFTKEDTLHKTPARVLYEHPDGHQVAVGHDHFTSGRDGRQSHVVFFEATYVPSHKKEGVQLSTAALEATKSLLGWDRRGSRDLGNGNYLQARRARERAREGAHEYSARYHKELKEYHELQARTFGQAKEEYYQKTSKKHADAALAHGIAMDWHMENQHVANAKGDNCGTGAGGFKKGNTCATGGEVADSLNELKDKLGLTGGSEHKFVGTDHAMYNTKDYTSHAVAKMEYDRITKIINKLGFKAVSKTEGRLNGGIAVKYEHPHGHRLDVGLSHDREAFTWVQIEFVPKKFREALGLAEAAQTASVLATPNTEIPAQQAVTCTRHGQSQEAMNHHKFMMDYHGRSLQYTKDPEVRKQHERAIAAHSIARDWHMDNLGVTNGKWKPVQRS